MHDRNGTPLELGDIVTLRLRVIATTTGVYYCNVNLEYGFEAEAGPANVIGSLSAINTRQLLLVEKASNA